MGRHKLQTSGLKKGTSLQILDINRIIRVYKKFHAKIIYIRWHGKISKETHIIKTDLNRKYEQTYDIIKKLNKFKTSHV